MVGRWETEPDVRAALEDCGLRFGSKWHTGVLHDDLTLALPSGLPGPGTRSQLPLPAEHPNSEGTPAPVTCPCNADRKKTTTGEHESEARKDGGLSQSCVPSYLNQTKH